MSLGINVYPILGSRDRTARVILPRLNMEINGHLPALHIVSAYQGRVGRGNGHVTRDCGAGFGLPLGCRRLEAENSYEE